MTETKHASVAKDEAWRLYKGRAGEPLRVTPIYKMKLNGPTPKHIAIYPKEIRTGDQSRGRKLIDGQWQIGCESLQLPAQTPPWCQAMPSNHFVDRLHRFEWFRDILAVGPEGVRLARRFLYDWCERYGKWDAFLWRIEVTADRLWNWMTAGPNALDSYNPEMRATLMESLIRQKRHLQFSYKASANLRGRMRAICVMIMVDLGLPGQTKSIKNQFNLLKTECDRQILADGGHISRNPEILLESLLDLQTIEDLCLKTATNIPEFLPKLITRMGRMVAFFCSGDGVMFAMNGGGESYRRYVAAALEPFDKASNGFSFATKSSVQKICAGDMRVLLDVGAAPDQEFAMGSHAGCMGFELHDGRSRIVTSCGNSIDLEPKWCDITRRTVSHSTLSIQEQNSASFVSNPTLGIDSPVGPVAIKTKRMEDNNRVWIDAQHSGWRDRFGLIHRRRLFATGDGNRLTGEDALIRPASEGDAPDHSFVPFSIHFHLHPQVTLQTDEAGIFLRLGNGRIWQFKTSHTQINQARSVYLANPCGPCNSVQIILSGEANPNGVGTESTNCIRWAFVCRESP